MLPFATTFTGHLETAEAIYEGSARNLVGIKTFSGNGGNARANQGGLKRFIRAPVAGYIHRMQDEAVRKKPAAFHVGLVDAGVADLGIGHRDELAAVRRIAQDLLVSRHAGIENDFAPFVFGRAHGGSAQDRAILQRQKGGLVPLFSPIPPRSHENPSADKNAYSLPGPLPFGNDGEFQVESRRRKGSTDGGRRLEASLCGGTALSELPQGDVTAVELRRSVR